MRSQFVLGLLLCIGNAGALAAECRAVSAPHRVPVLELYTSEGCDSCPPADRWISGLPLRGFGADRLVSLAFHVDYWDRLGWPDRFAQARFTERQRVVNERNRSRVIYTPQLVLNGRDYRRGLTDDLALRVAAISREPARASISLMLSALQAEWHVTGQSSLTELRDTQLFVALYENNLESEVKAGENRNKRLHHDFVVRHLAGPFAYGAFSHAFSIDRGWKRADLSVAAFMQDARTGDVLQAVALSGCR
jgi:hypothetical protein